MFCKVIQLPPLNIRNGQTNIIYSIWLQSNSSMSNMYECVHTHECAFACVCMYVCLCVCLHGVCNVYMHTCIIFISIHTCIHTYICTYVCMHSKSLVTPVDLRSDLMRSRLDDGIPLLMIWVIEYDLLPLNYLLKKKKNHLI